MNQAFRLAIASLLAFAGLALVPSMLPAPAVQKFVGSAFAQNNQMLANDGGSIEDLTRAERMKKSRTVGPGMKSLVHDAPKYCVDCHRGHDRNRARRSRSVKR